MTEEWDSLDLSPICLQLAIGENMENMSQDGARLRWFNERTVKVHIMGGVIPDDIGYQKALGKSFFV